MDTARKTLLPGGQYLVKNIFPSKFLVIYQVCDLANECFKQNVNNYKTTRFNFNSHHDVKTPADYSIF